MNCERCPLIRNIQDGDDPCLDCTEEAHPSREEVTAQDRATARRKQATQTPTRSPTYVRSR